MKKIICVFLMAAVIFCMASCAKETENKSGPADVAMQYVSASLSGDYIKRYDYTFGPSFKETLNIQSELSGLSSSDLRKEAEDAEEEQKEKLKEEYGSIYTINFTSVKKEKIGIYDIEDFVEGWNENIEEYLENDKLSSSQKFTVKMYKLDPVQIRGAYKVTLDYSISGSKDTYNGKKTVFVGKIRGEWKVIN